MRTRDDVTDEEITAMRATMSNESLLDEEDVAAIDLILEEVGLTRRDIYAEMVLKRDLNVKGDDNV